MLPEGTEPPEYRSTIIHPYCLFQGTFYWAFLYILTVMNIYILPQLYSIKSKC